MAKLSATQRALSCSDPPRFAGVVNSRLKLPAIKDLGQLGDHLPVVVIDSREQAPLPLRRLPFVTGTLQCAFEDQLWDPYMISRPAVMTFQHCLAMFGDQDSPRP